MQLRNGNHRYLIVVVLLTKRPEVRRSLPTIYLGNQVRVMVIIIIPVVLGLHMWQVTFLLHGNQNANDLVRPVLHYEMVAQLHYIRILYEHILRSRVAYMCTLQFKIAQQLAV